MPGKAIVRRATGGLLRVEEARRVLARCKTVEEAKSIRDKAEAIAKLLRGQRGCHAEALHAEEWKLRAERRIGEFLEPDKEKRGGAKLSRSILPPGVSPFQSMRWQDVARVKPEKFEGFIQQEREKDNGEITTSGLLKRVRAEVKREAKLATAEAIRGEPVPLPEGPYRVIAVDPPWRYGSRVEDATHRGRTQYPEMSIEEICALPVQSRAHPDGCVLWLWTTNAFMRDAYRCLDAWGFEEKTILTWDKEHLGLGDWLRNVTEHCILAVRGAPVVTLTNQTTLIREARREHSRKPEAFYVLVEALCPGSKLEMFARDERAGWVAWGAESTKFSEAVA